MSDQRPPPKCGPPSDQLAALTAFLSCTESWEAFLLKGVVINAAATDHIHILGLSDRGRIYVVSGTTLTHAITYVSMSCDADAVPDFHRELAKPHCLFHDLARRTALEM